MSLFASMPTTGQGTLGDMREFLARLLRAGLVDWVLVPVETRDHRSVQLTLIGNPEQMASANPLMPVLPVSGARVASLLNERGAASSSVQGQAQPRRVAVVLRACEFRAAVELAKLKQVNLEGLMTVVIDCVGTYEVVDVRESDQSAEALVHAAAAEVRAGRSEPSGSLSYRHACTICVNPVAANADLGIHTIGVKEAEGLLIELADGSLSEPLGLAAEADPSGHRDALSGLVATRAARRDEVLDAMVRLMAPREDGTPGLVELFDQCQRCHNCSTACPICYCKECLFRTETFRSEPRRYRSMASSRGLVRMPGDAITFQLTRLSHVSTSCVGCGLCSSACPAGLPVDAVFQAVARQTQALFDYDAGRDVKDPLPTTTFQREEFVSLGES